MSRQLRLTSLLLVAALATVSCAGSKFMNVSDVPVPPTARKGALEGAYEIKLRTIGTEVVRELKEKHGKADAMMYFLAPEADWNAVTAFYDERLGAAGMKRDSSFPAERAGYQLAAWSGGGWLDKETVAVALIESGTTADGKPQKFLAVFLASD